jgi:hypothetical protein
MDQGFRKEGGKSRDFTGGRRESHDFRPNSLNLKAFPVTGGRAAMPAVVD